MTDADVRAGQGRGLEHPRGPEYAPPTVPESSSPAARPRVPPGSDLTLGIQCVDKSEPGVTVWTMTAGEHLANPTGVVQGGMLAAFADTAMTAATITNVRGRKVYSANMEMKTSFVRAAPVGETYTCTARVIGGGSRVAFTEAEIVDSRGRLVAKASSTYLLTPRD